MAAMTQDLKTLRIAIEAICQQAWTHDSRNKKLSVLRDHVHELQLNYNPKDYLSYSWEQETLPDGLKALEHYLRDTAYGEIHTQVLRRLWVAVDIISYLINKIENTSPRQTREEREAKSKGDSDKVWRDALDEIDPDGDQSSDEADTDTTA